MTTSLAQMFRFFGVLMGIAIRTGSPLSLNLAEPMWKQVCSCSCSYSCSYSCLPPAGPAAPVPCGHHRGGPRLCAGAHVYQVSVKPQSGEVR